MENLEEKLLDQKLLEPWQLEKATVSSRNSGQSLWVSLVKSGFMSEEAIALFLAQESGIPYVKVADYAIDQAILRLIEEDFALQNQIIPLFKLDNTLFVACSNPLGTAVLDSAAKMSGCIIEPLAAEAHAILGALDLYWRQDEKGFELAKFIIKKTSVQGFVQWRGAQRLPLELPFELKILGDEIVLLSRRAISGRTFNISADGCALGIQTDIFLPQGLIVLISLAVKAARQPIPDKSIEFRAQVVRSEMVKSRNYLLAVKLLNSSEAVKKELLSFAVLK
jgi:hypothetical protein